MNERDAQLNIIHREIELLMQDIVVQYDMLGMRASGAFAERIEQQTEVTKDKYTSVIKGLHYTDYLVSGRPPSEKLPPIAAILKWIEDKGIKPIKESTNASSLAWAIAKKIAREGTRYFKQGGTDLVESVVTPQRIQEIINKITLLEVNYFTTQLQNKLKQLQLQ